MSLALDLSRTLQLPTKLVEGLAHKASHSYKVYEIPKRSGEMRTIHHPSRGLKALQRCLLKHVVSGWRVHDAAYAYRLQRSIYDHAQVHERCRFLLRLDLVDFFPSIAEDDVRAYLTGTPRPRGTESWKQADVDLFVQLVCRQGRLTIGAPTSPALSNAMCWDLDAQLSQLWQRSDTVYTRYADDMFFSSVHPGILRDVPEQVDVALGLLPCPAHLVRNVAKTHHSSRRRRQRVTGITLSSDGRAVLGRARKREIRSLLHRFDQLQPTEQARLRGLLAYGRSIEPDLVNALIIKYGISQVNKAM